MLLQPTVFENHQFTSSMLPNQIRIKFISLLEASEPAKLNHNLNLLAAIICTTLNLKVLHRSESIISALQPEKHFKFPAGASRRDISHFSDFFLSQLPNNSGPVYALNSFCENSKFGGAGTHVREIAASLLSLTLIVIDTKTDTAKTFQNFKRWAATVSNEYQDSQQS